MSPNFIRGWSESAWGFQGACFISPSYFCWTADCLLKSWKKSLSASWSAGTITVSWSSSGVTNPGILLVSQPSSSGREVTLGCMHMANFLSPLLGETEGVLLLLCVPPPNPSVCLLPNQQLLWGQFLHIHLNKQLLWGHHLLRALPLPFPGPGFESNLVEFPLHLSCTFWSRVVLF